MKIRNLIIAGTIAGTALAGLSAYGNSPAVKTRTAAEKAEAQQRVRIDQAKEQFTNCIDGNRYSCKAAVKNNLLTADQLKQSEAKLVVLDKQFEQKQAETKAKADAEAKFKAEGWWEVKPGIFVRWCTQTCSTAEVIGDASYWLMEVWAKDHSAGDIYAQINIEQNGVVTGWTNDTAFLSKGQRGILTFQKYGLSNGAAYQARLVKFNARG